MMRLKSGLVYETIFEIKNSTCRQMVLFSTSLTLYDGGRYHIETSPLICRANQWTGFYMITASVMKELHKVTSL